MAKVTYQLVNLTGGEITPRLDGRPDVAKQRNGLRVCENFQVVTHGGIRKRSGTRYVVELKSGSDDVVLQPFQYSTEQAYMLVFGPNYIWIMKDRGVLTDAAVNVSGITKANPGVVTATAHGFSNGDRVILSSVGGMTEVNNRQFVVANVTANTFELSGVNTSSYSTYTSGGTVASIIEITTTYAESELQELRFAQYNDVLYITHQNHPLRKLSRASNTSWTLSAVSISTGPFRQINGDDDHRMTVSFPSSSITGATQANPCVVTATGHPFSNGDRVLIESVGGMTQINNLSHTVANATANTFELLAVDSTAYGAYTSGGAATAAATSYGTYEVGQSFTLTSSQAYFDADMVGALFRLNEDGGGTGVVGPKIGDTSSYLNPADVYTYDGKVYGVSDMKVNGVSSSAFAWVPFNRVPAHDRGFVRVVGKYATNVYEFRSNFLHPTYCVVQITGFTSSTVVTAEIVRYQMPSSIVDVGTAFWEEGAWSAYRGYPRCCAFFEQRLFLAGSTSEPAVLWSSKSGAFEDFSDGPDNDDALVYRASSGYADVIRWLSGGRVLAAGTSQGEYAIAASNQNEALTPSNLRMLLQTTYGTSHAPPIRINEAVLYPQRSGEPSNPALKLREFTYDFTADRFNSVDVSIFAEHITGTGLTRIAYQMQPDAMIWGVRVDGQLPVCTYERAQEVVAWQRHVLGGNGIATAIGVCAGSDGDDVWVVVERTIASTTVRYVEVFLPPFEPAVNVKADAVLVDASLTYSGASASTLTGLWHLRGEAVSILNNGSIETATVSNTGTVTLATATTKAHIGYAYSAIAETEDIDAGAQAGASQSRMKRISQVYMRVYGSLGGTVGSSSSRQDDLLYRDTATVLDSSPPLFSGLIEVDFRGEYGREATVRIEHDDPVPFFVTAIVSELSTQG